MTFEELLMGVEPALRRYVILRSGIRRTRRTFCRKRASPRFAGTIR